MILWINAPIIPIPSILKYLFRYLLIAYITRKLAKDALPPIKKLVKPKKSRFPINTFRLTNTTHSLKSKLRSAIITTILARPILAPGISGKIKEDTYLSKTDTADAIAAKIAKWTIFCVLLIQSPLN